MFSLTLKTHVQEISASFTPGQGHWGLQWSTFGQNHLHVSSYCTGCTHRVRAWAFVLWADPLARAAGSWSFPTAPWWHWAVTASQLICQLPQRENCMLGKLTAKLVAAFISFALFSSYTGMMTFFVFQCSEFLWYKVITTSCLRNTYASVNMLFCLGIISPILLLLCIYWVQNQTKSQQISC